MTAAGGHDHDLAGRGRLPISHGRSPSVYREVKHLSGPQLRGFPARRRPRRRGIGCRACGSASWHRAAEPSSGPCSSGICRSSRRRRPAVRRTRDRPTRTASRPSSSSAPTSAPSFDRVAYTHDVVDALHRHDVDLVAIAGFGTILSKPFVDAYGGRAVNTHPALLPVVQGLARGARRARVRREGDRADRAPRHRGRRLRADPRPRGRPRPRRRHRGDPARTHQGSRAPLVPRRHRTGS